MTEYARLEEMNDEERLLTLAAEQLYGRQTYDTSFWDSRTEEKVQRVGPVPPRSKFVGQYPEAIRAATVYEEVAPALKELRDKIENIAGELEEGEPISGEEAENLAVALREHVYRLSGVLRDRHSSDDMDIEVPAIFEAVFQALVRKQRANEYAEWARTPRN